MRTTTPVLEHRAMSVRVVDCADDHAGWSAPEPSRATQLVLVRSGRFRLRSHEGVVTVDPTHGYLLPAGHEARFAHPVGGDVCTSITLHDETLLDEVDLTRAPSVPVDARLELAHRGLLRSRHDPGLAAAEAVVGLLGLAVRHEHAAVRAPGSQRLADAAREAMLADDPAARSLVALARRLDASPSHLSRTFRHHVGMSLTRYRGRIRVSRALQLLDDGADDLAGIAATLGFTDQAHLTRTMRRETGRTPGQVRARLAPR